MSHNYAHVSNPQVVNRLKRAGGHLNNVIGLIEEHQPCALVVQQLHAVEKAIGAAKRALIHDHFDHGLDEAISGRPVAMREMVDEFRELSKYF